MADITKPSEIQEIQKPDPSALEVQEAGAKVTRAQEASPGTAPAPESSENEKLKLKVTDQGENERPEEKIAQASDFRQKKGDALEQAHAQVVEQDKNNVLLLEHDSSTQQGFDNVYYDQSKDKVIITEEKNYGSEGKPGYISNISAWENSERFEKNLDKLMQHVEQSDQSEEMKDKVALAIQEDRIERELVIGPHSRVSENKINEYNIDRVIRLDPSNQALLKV